MKKFIVLSAVLASTSFSFAQIKIRPGIIAGANYTTIEGKDVDAGTQFRFGFHAGVMSDIKISDIVSIQPEIIYSTHGAKIEMEEGMGRIGLSYINLPLTLKAITKFGMYGTAGVEGGYLLSAKAKNKAGDTKSFKDMSKNFRAGWTVGAGYQSKAGIGIGFSYTSDFTSFLKDDKMNNSGFRGSVFYIF
ncbi:MAG: PorT family protein [Bacteroidetes bacterium]|nr:PorT family protein [Bacteroidota bacterium]